MTKDESKYLFSIIDSLRAEIEKLEKRDSQWRVNCGLIQRKKED